MRYFLLIFILIIYSCDDIDSPQCQNSGWIIDDCGICRECDTEECNWNGTMNLCGGCDNDVSECTGCMDPEAINTNENVHRVLYNNLENSPMFSGKISGIGPRSEHAIGRPEAIASKRLIPKVSQLEGKAKRSTSLYHFKVSE